MTVYMFVFSIIKFEMTVKLFEETIKKALN